MQDDIYLVSPYVQVGAMTFFHPKIERDRARGSVTITSLVRCPFSKTSGPCLLRD
jgi:hypothetical protein